MNIEDVVVLSYKDNYGRFYVLGESIYSCQKTIAEEVGDVDNVKQIPFKDWDQINLLLEYSNQESMTLLDYIQTITDFFPHILEGD